MKITTFNKSSDAKAQKFQSIFIDETFLLRFLQDTFFHFVRHQFSLPLALFVCYSCEGNMQGAFRMVPLSATEKLTQWKGGDGNERERVRAMGQTTSTKKKQVNTHWQDAHVYLLWNLANKSDAWEDKVYVQIKDFPRHQTLLTCKAKHTHNENNKQFHFFHFHITNHKSFMDIA